MNDSRPLGMKAYGRILHLPGSRLGPAERHLSAGLTARLTVQPGVGEQVWIQEKLDGTNVAVARIGDELVALTRAGYRAADSRRLQGRLFAAWVGHHSNRFLEVLNPGERVVGEWLYHAHGTRYALPHEPFVAFDLMRGQERSRLEELTHRMNGALVLPGLLASEACEPASVFRELNGRSRHGALGQPEGLVYRLEAQGRVSLVAKWVRSEYEEGAYFQDGEAVLPNTFQNEEELLLTQLQRRLDY